MERFADIVDAVNELPLGDQVALAQILKQRLAAQERKEIVKDVTDAREECRVNGKEPQSAGSIMDEIRDGS